jgi:hypothetical protein
MKLKSALHYSNTPKSPSTPLYALRKLDSTWGLTFDGNKAQIKDEPVMKYVAYLLLNPPAEPMFGVDLASKADALYGKRNALTEITHPYTGEIIVVPSEARIQERHLGLDDAEAMRWALRKQNDLEALLEAPDLIEPVRAEIHRELIALYEYERLNSKQVFDAAQKTVLAIRRALKRLQKRLTRAVDSNGFPHPVLRAFAAHLQQHLIEPSYRFKHAAARREKDDAAGCFTYQPPNGVAWNT